MQSQQLKIYLTVVQGKTVIYQISIKNDTDRDPDFEPESNFNSDTEKEMSDNEEESIVLPCNSNDMTMQEYHDSSTNVFEGGNAVQNLDSNVTENNYTQDIDLNVDEVNENVVNGAGDCAQIEVESEIEYGVGFLRGYQSFFFGRRAKEMVKKNIPPFKWEKNQPSSNVRKIQHNILVVTRVRMLNNFAKVIGDKPEVEDVWKLFFTDNIMQKIVLETNKKKPR